VTDAEIEEVLNGAIFVFLAAYRSRPATH
jgi:hypothetical protein